jgi:gliding motility-associated-like protein
MWLTAQDGRSRRPIIGPSALTEACVGTSINIIRPAGVQGDLIVDMSYTGTAENGSDFNWPATRTIGTDLLNVIFPFDALEDGVAEDLENATITASYTDACGRTVSASITITIIDAPPILLQTTNSVVDCGPDSVAVTVDASGGFGSLDLEWNTGDTGPVIWVPVLTGGTYVVTATDDCGRTVSAQSVVEVDCEIIIPNVFSPNGDGKNDRFDIEGIINTQNTVRVFNRWGQVVFEATNYRNNWAATDVPDGTYYYEVTVARDPKPHTGHVTILR